MENGLLLMLGPKSVTLSTELPGSVTNAIFVCGDPTRLQA